MLLQYVRIGSFKFFFYDRETIAEQNTTKNILVELGSLSVFQKIIQNQYFSEQGDKWLLLSCRLSLALLCCCALIKGGLEGAL